MKSTCLLDYFHTRPKVKMVGVSKDYLSSYLQKVLMKHGLDRSLGSYGHKDWRFYPAMGRYKLPEPCLSIGLYHSKGEH